MAAQGYAPAVLISGDGTFNNDIDRHLNLAFENDRIGAVSVIGVQSSGKSTLMNRCFSTKFQEMDGSQGPQQTTRGIWIQKCSSPEGHRNILVLDTEGTDGRERGQEGNGAFERQTTFFALAMSNVMLLNMKYDNLNLNNGGSRPLLETMFQVMVRNFSTARRVHLLIVIRDRPPKSPMDKLKERAIVNLHEIWNGIFTSQGATRPVLEDYLTIEVDALHHYEYMRDQFEMEVVWLRDRIFQLVQQNGSAPAEFVNLARQNWKDIKDEKILNIELNRKLVDGVHCDMLREEMVRGFGEDQDWIDIMEGVKDDMFIKTKNFGNQVSSIIGIYLTRYDDGTLYLHEETRDERRQQLIRHILRDVEPTYLTLVKKQRAATAAFFVKEIIEKLTAKFETLDPDMHIAEYENLLQDVRIEHANWNHPSEQLELLRTEIAGYKKQADDIHHLLKQKEENSKSIVNSIERLVFSLMFTLPAAGFAAGVTVASGGAALPAVIGVAAVISSEGLSMTMGRFNSFMNGLLSCIPGAHLVVDVYEWFKIKKRLKKSRQKEDPAAKKIWEEYKKSKSGRKEGSTSKKTLEEYESRG
ncbi:OLC1v1000127C1 [Oldenlandia corymbosa var. corymbosa]|uniref:OLC1v1000127C1 n=1 Tax=Oldenlandia corymbosa var. corymbosa TaxID=529605 RepID=A0AAV1D4Y3_OLDCO|nr:OLC1v1000127C1 [Oldenlandia corymbosa var. corymbosa]